MADWAKDAAVGGITVTETPEATVAHLWGEVDDALRQQAGTVLARALDRNLPVVIDTSRVEFIDSAGIAFLIQFCTIGREEGMDVTLHDPPRVVSEVLNLLGLSDLFDGEDHPTAEGHPTPA
jgi:anti-anti-sigma factor